MGFLLKVQSIYYISFGLGKFSGMFFKAGMYHNHNQSLTVVVVVIVVVSTSKCIGEKSS